MMHILFAEELGSEPCPSECFPCTSVPKEVISQLVLRFCFLLQRIKRSSKIKSEQIQL